MFSFSTNPTITINFNGQDTREKKLTKVQGQEPVELPVYSGQEVVSGVVDISIPPGKKVDHQGVRIEMIGQTGNDIFSNFDSSYLFHELAELYYERGNSIKFTSLVRELESVGSMTQNKVCCFILWYFVLNFNFFYFQSYPFEFSTEKPYESYRLNIT